MAPTAELNRANPLRRLIDRIRLHPEQSLQIAIAVLSILLFLLPVAAVVVSAFKRSPFQDEWSLEGFLRVMTDDRTWTVTVQTIGYTIATVIPALVIACVFALLVTRTNAWARWLITATMAILVATPPLFYAISWGLLGNKSVGLINQFLRFGQAGTGPFDIESWGGLILVSVFRTAAFMFILLVGPFAAMDRSLEEAARVSGAGGVRTFLGTQIPTLFPAISGVAILSTIATMEAFDLPLVLGVPAGIYLLPTEVHAYLNDSAGPQYGAAGSVAVILLVLLLGLVTVQQRMQGRRRYTTVSGKATRNAGWDLGFWRAPILLITLAFFVAAVGLPITQLVLGSLSPFFGATQGYSLDNFTAVLDDRSIVEAFGTTALVAGTAAALAVLVSGFFLWVARLRRSRLASFIDMSQMIIMAAPGLLLALGIVTLLVASPLRGLYGTNTVLIFAMFVAIVPLVSRSISGALAQIPFDLEEAMRVSGATRIRSMVFVVARLLLPSILNGWMIGFVVMSGSLAIPMLLSPRTTTLLSVRVYDMYLAGSVEKAAAVFVLLILEVLVVSAIVGIIGRALSTKSSAPKSTRADAQKPHLHTMRLATQRRRRVTSRPARTRTPA